MTRTKGNCVIITCYIIKGLTVIAVLLAVCFSGYIAVLVIAFLIHLLLGNHDKLSAVGCSIGICFLRMIICMLIGIILNEIGTPLNVTADHLPKPINPSSFRKIA